MPDLQELLDYILVRFGAFEITAGEVALAVLCLIALAVVAYMALARWIPDFFVRQEVEKPQRRSFRLSAYLSFLLLGALVIILTLGLNPILYDNEALRIRLSTPIAILLAWQLARLTDRFVSRVLERRYRLQHEADTAGERSLDLPPRRKKRPQTHTVQYVVYLIAFLILLNMLQLDPNLANINFGQGDPVYLTITKLILAVIILLGAQVVVWIFTELVLHRYYKANDVNVGSQYAINQLIRYVLFVVAALIALQNIGLNMTVIWGGAAALLVGIGLGLQQTFNDFFSGIVLLFERSVEVGDIIDVGGLVGTVRRIGLRSSRVQTRNNISVIVPNSKLVVDNVVNWSHGDNRARFLVEVGVAYGSDTALVKKLLLGVTNDHDMVLKYPRPFVRFRDFGNSSLQFELHFWSTEFMLIENVKSDLRFRIDQAFRAHQVTIPFPQRDVWFKNVPPGQDTAASPGDGQSAAEQPLNSG